MSWFSEFSEKAETILNTIDKNAAKVLNKRPNLKSSYNDDSALISSAPSVITEKKITNFDYGLEEWNSPSTCAETLAEVVDHQSSSVRNEFCNDYLRNEMLQNEIHSLNNEISLLLNRVKLEERRSIDLNTQLTISKEKNIKLEEQLAEFRSWRSSNNDICDIAPNLTKQEKQHHKKFSLDETSVEHYDKQIQELLQEKSNLQQTLREKEDEIILLKSRLSQKTYCFSADELQSRLRALTITLVEKQSAMESLMQEKNNLISKLNHLQKRYDEALGILHQSRINMNDTDDVKAQAPVYSSSDSFSQHMRKLYWTLVCLTTKNKLSLRRMSTAKLLVIVYVIFMHGLVFLLLYTHTPESTDMQSKD